MLHYELGGAQLKIRAAKKAFGLLWSRGAAAWGHAYLASIFLSGVEAYAFSTLAVGFFVALPVIVSIQFLPVLSSYSC